MAVKITSSCDIYLISYRNLFHVHRAYMCAAGFRQSFEHPNKHFWNFHFSTQISIFFNIEMKCKKSAVEAIKSSSEVPTNKKQNQVNLPINMKYLHNVKCDVNANILKFGD